MSEPDRHRQRDTDRASTHRSVAHVLAALFAVLCMMTAATAAEPESDPAAHAGLDVVFVLDNSGSMRQHDPRFLTRTAVKNFAETLAADSKANGRIAIVLFDGRARLVQPLTRIENGDAQTLLARPLSTLDFTGQRTDGPSGIERALYELRKNGRADAEKAIIFLTDGKIDTGNHQRDLEATRWLREDLAEESLSEGIRIFGVAFTEGADYQMMQALALKTRARYYRAFKAAELDSVVSDIFARLDEGQPLPLAPAVAPQRPTSVVNPASVASDTPLPPSVASAPADIEDSGGLGLLALLPVAILLLAGSFVWLRRRESAPLGSEQDADGIPGADLIAPKAQLLDPYGHLGQRGGIITLATGRTTLGRDPQSDLVLENDAVSSQHATIEVRNGRYWLEDLRSTNGTRIGGERLEAGVPTPLKGGDHIRFGEIDLMFMLVGYVPGGGTILLGSTTSERKSPEAEGSESSEATPQAVRSDSASDQSHISLLPSLHTEVTANEIGEEPEHEREQESTERSIALVPDSRIAEAPPVENDYRTCLDFHLARVEEISPALAAFVSRAFDDEMRDALSFAGLELLENARSSGEIEQKSYTAHGVRYVAYAVPQSLDRACDEFGRAFGGFTRLLTGALQDESFIRERCEILAVIVFGRANEPGSTPWVSLSIVPDEGRDPSIDLLSYEFLTEEERREIAPHDDVGHSTSS